MSSSNKIQGHFDIVTFGEILIDFTSQGKNADGQMLYARNPGGAPANVAVAASRLGARTAFMGKVGMDLHGKFLSDTLRKEKVDIQGLIADNEFFTTLAFVEIDNKGERSFSFARKPGADTKMQRKDINLNILSDASVFHVGSLSLTDEPSRDTTIYAVEKAKEFGSIISYDPNYRAPLWKDTRIAVRYMRSLIPYVDMIKISEEETDILTGNNGVEQAASALLEQGVAIVAITLGEKGVYVCCKDGKGYIPGVKAKKVADTTGAGDSFWGGFLTKFCMSQKDIHSISYSDIESFAKFGNAVASLCVEKKGAIPAMPEIKQVNDRLGCKMI